MAESYPQTLAAARARIAAVRPAAYARSRSLQSAAAWLAVDDVPAW